MKLLKLAFSGLPLFSGEIGLSFLATQRVSAGQTESMHQIVGRHYQNNVISVIGVNASGKTRLMKVLDFTMGLLHGNMPINRLPGAEVLSGLGDGQEVLIKSWFCSDQDQAHFLKTVIRKNMGRYVIAEEELKSKYITRTITKKALYEFGDVQPGIIRNEREAGLPDDLSVMSVFNRHSNAYISYFNVLRQTDTNLLETLNGIPMEIVTLFDPGIEYLHVHSEKNLPDIRLKYRHQNEMVLASADDLNKYLSSGTIRGANLLALAMRAFETDGYLLVDDLETHINREIVCTLIYLFCDKRINPKGAVLIFTTHCPELLDAFDRDDNIFLTRNRNGITVQCLANAPKCNDVEKSVAYESGLLEGTVLAYESYIALKKMLYTQHKKEGGHQLKCI